MPYTTVATDPTQPLDTDQGLVLGAEMRAVKNYIGAIPPNIQAGNYTTVAIDAGKCVFHPGSDLPARSWNIADNATVPYRIGTVITFSNQHGGGTVTLGILGTDILRLLPGGATGARTFPANSVATAMKITATEWQISGTGIS